MNQSQEQRLEDIFRTNDNNGIAIAITGSWGVGKTFFWNSFLKVQSIKEQERKYLPLSVRLMHKNFFDKKYAYVSLFGIENLSDLKAAISTNMSSNYFNQESTKNFEIPTFIKKGLTALREVKLTSSEYGISSSARIFESVLYAQVKDAIICFDDFERMSNKLDIKDVMGLANQLKLERNCQVVLILDEDKAEGENKKKYAEYKEKLIDETIKITSVEPLIRANTKDIDDDLVNLMIKFAEELEIHNFRFFQKVIKLYSQFLDQLPKVVADSTKLIILTRILQGYFISDFGVKYDFQWEDIQLVLEDNQKDWSERKVKTYKALQNISYNFIHSDVWLSEFKKWFDQVDELDFGLLKELASSELISEKNNDYTKSFHAITKKFWKLQADENFPKDLFEITKKVIGLENLGNISFAIKLLELFGHSDQAIELECIACEWIHEQMIRNRRSFIGINQLGEIRPVFEDYIEKFELSSEHLPILVDAVFKIFVNGAGSSEDELSVEKANKQQWKELLFIQILQDERFNDINSSYIVKKILERPTASNFKASFRTMITEIYEEKGKESEFYKNYMDYLITRLEN
ncbi:MULTISPECIES: P-loop NTPase fold protein [unclassified Acinetobacter]|uniref:P-loop NTPase fold protein n=1 Tax=unclassified Acinetobacter TaxID=196816 RepID=UPI0015D463D9|nr:MULTISPECIES: P-loop NTPase fold protein [unclassified Acinetobacter]QOW48472.1 KAP family P-loop domain protein [Acinetobacter sp. YH12138]